MTRRCHDGGLPLQAGPFRTKVGVQVVESNQTEDANQKKETEERWETKSAPLVGALQITRVETTDTRRLSSLAPARVRRRDECPRGHKRGRVRAARGVVVVLSDTRRERADATGGAACHASKASRASSARSDFPGSSATTGCRGMSCGQRIPAGIAAVSSAPSEGANVAASTRSAAKLASASSIAAASVYHTPSLPAASTSTKARRCSAAVSATASRVESRYTQAQPLLRPVCPLVCDSMCSTFASGHTRPIRCDSSSAVCCLRSCPTKTRHAVMLLSLPHSPHVLLPSVSALHARHRQWNGTVAATTGAFALRPARPRDLGGFTADINDDVRSACGDQRTKVMPSIGRGATRSAAAAKAGPAARAASTSASDRLANTWSRHARGSAATEVWLRPAARGFLLDAVVAAAAKATVAAAAGETDCWLPTKLSPPTCPGGVAEAKLWLRGLDSMLSASGSLPSTMSTADGVATALLISAASAARLAFIRCSRCAGVSSSSSSSSDASSTASSVMAACPPLPPPPNVL
mmetsp:Transcript_27001/g.83604  ORF Transcript_27001/g.83604 Transcript_27001/m.83604 type:complete len:524 (+) Transcript_27001:132-1703(+)